MPAVIPDAALKPSVMATSSVVIQDAASKWHPQCWQKCFCLPFGPVTLGGSLSGNWSGSFGLNCPKVLPLYAGRYQKPTILENLYKPPIQTMGNLFRGHPSRFSRATPALTPLPLPTRQDVPGYVLVAIVIAHLPDLVVRSLSTAQPRRESCSCHLL